MEDTHKKVLIVVVILVVVVGVAIYVTLNGQQSRRGSTPPAGERGVGTETGERADSGAESDREASEETRQLIEEVQQRSAERGTTTATRGGTEVTWEDDEEGTSTETRTGVRVAEGGSPIDAETGRVVTEEGEETDASAEPGSANAPKQSFTVDEEDVPERAIKMRITPDNIDPEQFTVSAGQAVAISVTAAGDATEIFRFVDESLQSIGVGVSPGKTRVISFNAPDEPGEYTYYSDVADHRSQGAEGVMIVE